MKFIIYFILFLLSQSFISCKDEPIEKKYFASGNLEMEKVFDINGKLKNTIYYYDQSGKQSRCKIYFHKSKYDSVATYYKNGNLFKSGKQDKNGNGFGLWEYYTKSGFLSECREYWVINNEVNKGSIVNQHWFYNKQRDTMFWSRKDFNFFDQAEFREVPFTTRRSVFVDFQYYPETDTISIDEPLKAIVSHRFPIMSAQGSKCCVIIPKEGFSFNKDFSNEKEIEVDTFVCVGKDKINGKYFPDENPNYSVVFGKRFKTPGQKILRGYVVEYYKRKKTPNNNLIKEESRIYFEREIFVKE